MAVKHVQIPDIGPVALYKRRGNRSLRLSVASDGEIRVSMPYWLPYKAGEQFALGKSEWIAAHRQNARQPLQHGQAIGKAHRLHIAVAAEAKRVTSRVQANLVVVKHPPHYTGDHPAVQKTIRQAAARALQQEAEHLLPQRLRQLAEARALSYNGVRVRRLKSRWGSCSAQQEITLNIFLMQLPWHLIDYVILHELAHTRVMRHGRPFWQELERHVPNARQLRREIHQYQPAFG